MSCTKIVHHDVLMAVGREGFQELGHGGEVSEPEAEGWLCWDASVGYF